MDYTTEDPSKHAPSEKAPSEETAYDDPAVEHEVVQLARTVTNASLPNAHLGEGDNPFEGSADPRMDPMSGKFDYHLWIRTVLSLNVLHAGDGEAPGRTAGISYRNLNVYGYGKPTDHQRTVGGVLLDLPRMVYDLVGGVFGGSGGRGRRIDILRNFEGLVNAGEMLVVLGRPGRQVSFHSR